MKRLLITFVLVAVGVALAAPLALAGNESNPLSTGGQAGEALSGESTSGTLPFTGLNLALIVIGGLALLATGLLLRRRSGSNTTD